MGRPVFTAKEESVTQSEANDGNMSSHGGVISLAAGASDSGWINVFEASGWDVIRLTGVSFRFKNGNAPANGSDVAVAHEIRRLEDTNDIWTYRMNGDQTAATVSPPRVLRNGIHELRLRVANYSSQTVDFHLGYNVQQVNQ